MRNYIYLVGNAVYYSVDDVSFQRYVVWGGSLLEANSIAEQKLLFLQTFDPGYHIFEYRDQPGNTVPGMQPYYLELNKPNLLTLFQSIVLFDTVGANVFGCQDFSDVFVRESPRKIWSHGH